MPTCGECTNYIPIDGMWGDCNGYEVSGNRDICKCFMGVPMALRKDEMPRGVSGVTSMDSGREWGRC